MSAALSKQGLAALVTLPPEVVFLIKPIEEARFIAVMEGKLAPAK